MDLINLKSKEISLPFNSLTLNDDELFVIKGGLSTNAEQKGCGCAAGKGCGCKCGSKDAGKGCGCKCKAK